MTDELPTPRHTFGWCDDGHHNLCPQTWTSELGVTHTCSCPHHNDKEAD